MMNKFRYWQYHVLVPLWHALKYSWRKNWKAAKDQFSFAWWHL